MFSNLTLFDRATPTVDPAFTTSDRSRLDDRSWVDFAPTGSAIVSVGNARMLRLRPRSANGPRRSLGWELGHGHLFVMGGACQHDWEHCVPKTGAPVGPRISITFRHGAR